LARANNHQLVDAFLAHPDLRHRAREVGSSVGGRSSARVHRDLSDELRAVPDERSKQLSWI
jgi:hypothetical protein